MIIKNVHMMKKTKIRNSCLLQPINFFAFFNIFYTINSLLLHSLLIGQVSRILATIFIVIYMFMGNRPDLSSCTDKEKKYYNTLYKLFVSVLCVEILTGMIGPLAVLPYMMVLTIIVSLLFITYQIYLYANKKI